MKDASLDSTADSDVDRAKEMRDAGREEEALALLYEIINAHPRSAYARLVAGEILWGRGELREALSQFEEATVLVPRSEAASLSLFHIRLRLDDEEGAFREMRRFLADNESFEYRRLIVEFKKIPPQ